MSDGRSETRKTMITQRSGEHYAVNKKSGKRSIEDPENCHKTLNVRRSMNIPATVT